MSRRKTNRKNSESSSAHRWKPFIAAVLIIGTALIVYVPGIHGGFILDDDLYLTQNKLIADADGLYSFWFTTLATDYYPVSNSTLWLEWRLWGLNPTGYHVTNAILHALASFLVYLVLTQLRVPGALLAAVIFAVHPVNIESVEWIAQRKGLLAMVFFLLSVLWYLRSQIESPTLNLQYGLSLLAFVLAMLSKSSVATLPLVLLLLVWWRRDLIRRDWILIAPFFLLTIVMVRINVWFQEQSMGDFIRSAGFVERLLSAATVVWFYLYKAVCPIGLMFIYPQWKVRVNDPIWWAPLVAFIVVSLILWRARNGWGRSLFVAWSYFVVMLVPVMGFTDFGFMKYSLVADHYQYIAIVSVIAVFSGWWSLWLQRGAPGGRRIAMATGIVGVGVLIGLSWQQVEIYRDAPTLYLATTERNPACWIAHYNLGCILSEQKELPQAVARFEEALKYKSDYPEAHDNLGVALALEHRYPEAIGHYREAVRIKPDLARPHLNLGISLAYTGSLDDAVAQFREAIRIDPQLAEAHFNLGGALALQKKIPEAIASYEEAVKLKSDWREPRLRLSKLLADAGKLDLAAAHLSDLLRLRADDMNAHEQLGAILVAQGKFNNAIPHFLRVIQIQPAYTEGYLNLAKVYATTGRTSDAIATARAAIQMAQSTGQSEAAKRAGAWLDNLQKGPLKQGLSR
jgi:tetratricopeptide (TPR) repeat protein